MPGFVVLYEGVSGPLIFHGLLKESGNLRIWRTYREETFHPPSKAQSVYPAVVR
jgi:hypothetical protein